MSTNEPWQTGTTVILQEVWRGILWSARPLIVVEDQDDSLVLWCPRGTRWKTATTPPSRRRAATRAERFVAMLSKGDWVLADFSWSVSNLILVRGGAWHAVWVPLDDMNEVRGWYVNLQRPYRRTAHSLQTMDLMLAIVVQPDRTWQWKDEDEFQALVSHGLLDQTEAARIRDEAAIVIKHIEKNEPPFSEPWQHWRPDPSWSLPELPEGWERL